MSEHDELEAIEQEHFARYAARQSWTFTITGPDGQQGSAAAGEKSEILAAALNLINDCLDIPAPPPSTAEPQERKKARG